MQSQLAIEGVVVGFILAVIGTMLTSIMAPSSHSGSYIDVAAIFFISGVSTHFIFEALGANKWYCTKGHACLQ